MTRRLLNSICVIFLIFSAIGVAILIVSQDRFFGTTRSHCYVIHDDECGLAVLYASDKQATDENNLLVRVSTEERRIYAPFRCAEYFLVRIVPECSDLASRDAWLVKLTETDLMPIVKFILNDNGYGLPSPSMNAVSYQWNKETILVNTGERVIYAKGVYLSAAFIVAGLTTTCIAFRSRRMRTKTKNVGS